MPCEASQRPLLNANRGGGTFVPPAPDLNGRGLGRFSVAGRRQATAALVLFSQPPNPRVMIPDDASESPSASRYSFVSSSNEWTISRAPSAAPRWRVFEAVTRPRRWLFAGSFDSLATAFGRTEPTSPGSPIWFFHVEERQCSCMGVFGTDIVVALARTNLRQTRRIGKRNFRKTCSVIAKTAPR